MPRYNVKSDGEWACFSSISEEFVTPFMPLQEYEQWRINEYGESNVSLIHANTMTLGEAVYMLSLNHGDIDICKNLRFAGVLADKEEN